MATNPPPPAPESGIGGFLRTQIGPFPVWVWLIGVGVLAGIYFVPKILNRGTNTSAADATSADAGSSNAGISPAQSWFNTTSQAGIDPYTGVPYSIEESINPQTGNPNYYNPPPISVTQGPLPNTFQPQNNVKYWFSPVTNQPQSPDNPPPTPPVQNQPGPPIPTGSSITYPGGTTVPFGGGKFTTPGGIEVEHIAQQEYGFNKGSSQLQNAISALLKANQSQPGRGSWNAEHAPNAGDVITIPQVNLQTGQLI